MTNSLQCTTPGSENPSWRNLALMWMRASFEDNDELLSECVRLTMDKLMREQTGSVLEVAPAQAGSTPTCGATASTRSRGRGMTDDELRAIRERCDKATPGPWVAMTQEGGDGCVRACETYDGIARPMPNDDRPEDIEFIAHAREDVPALLAEVRRLQSALEEANFNIRLEQQDAKSAREYARNARAEALRDAAHLVRTYESDRYPGQESREDIACNLERMAEEASDGPA